MEQLRITEIFHSLQGESSYVGIPTVFVRLTGCPLRCTYCDTEYAFSGGEMMSFENIIEQIKEFQCQYVCVTGGEPLAQPACVDFMRDLCDQGYKVSIETSGAMDIKAIDPRVMIVMDLKGPSSNEVDKNLYENVEYLRAHDQVKFVVADNMDYQWAKEQIEKYRLDEKVKDVLISPSFGEIDLAELAQKVLDDKLTARMQVQLHKYIWGDAKGR